MGKIWKRANRNKGDIHLSWNPKYEVGDEVIVWLPDFHMIKQKVAFIAAVKITEVDDLGFYQFIFLKVFLNDYFNRQIKAGEKGKFHFKWVEQIPKEVFALIQDMQDKKEKVIFT